MKTVGIRELKANLSRVLRDVAAGDVFLVTDRGHVVAELRQPELGSAVGNPEQRALARLAAMGQLRVAERPPRPYARSPLKSRTGLAKTLLDIDRGE
jgi:antitoxin (DNA-binding transcriptional repressor) of toxin-antitoxin stability system